MVIRCPEEAKNKFIESQNAFQRLYTALNDEKKSVEKRKSKWSKKSVCCWALYYVSIKCNIFACCAAAAAAAAVIFE